MRKQGSDALKYTLLGAGVFSTLYLIMRARTANAQTLAQFAATYTPRRTDTPTFTEVADAKVFSDKKSRIPSMVLKFDKANNVMKLGKLNFTPRKFSTIHNEAEYGDLSYFDNLDVPADFSTAKPETTMHPNDYRILQEIGVIPANFPLERTQYVTSLNGKNEFFVGYSKPYKKTFNGNKTFTMSDPLWAVSMGRNFNTDSTPPSSIPAADIPALKDAMKRMLAAEFLLSNAGVNGCIPGVSLQLCDLERTALVGILLKRRAIRDKKKNVKGTFEDIAFASTGEPWNKGGKYLSGYNGHLGVTNKTDKSERQEFPDEFITTRFDDLYKHRLWHLPRLAGDGASHFGHPKSLKHVPKFLDPDEQTRRYPGDIEGYATSHAILVGGALVANQGLNFR